MGYYTNFNLRHDNDAIEAETLATELSEISGYRWEDDLALSSVKWYDWQKDMKKLSASHMGTLFTLKGEGEDSGDQWVAYVKSGKMQVVNAVITFAPFDESKLK